MVKKQIILSFAFCALILSSMISCTTTDPQADTASTQTSSAQLSQEATQQAPAAGPIEAAQPASAHHKTAGQRIVSGLGHTVLLMSSCLYLVSTLLKFTAREKAAFVALGTRGSYGALKGIYHAIAKREVVHEEPTELNKWTAAESALLIPSLFMLQSLRKMNDKPIEKLFLSLPAFYALGTSLKTIYKLAQNNNANSESQEPEIHAITE